MQQAPIVEAEARFEESLDVIVKSWTASEPFSHRGTYWSFEKIVTPDSSETASAHLDGGGR